MMKARRRRSTVLTFDNQRVDRDAYVVMMRRAGHSLQSIAETLGVSRERVRQLAARNGLSDRISLLQPPEIDPIALLRYARSSRDCIYFKDVARHFDLRVGTVKRMFHALGVNRALVRLFLWRRRNDARARQRQRVGAFVERYGRSPTVLELNKGVEGLPYLVDCQRVFGSWEKAREALGIVQRPAGAHGHLRPDERI
jgi:hypothetical protein